MCRLNAPWAPSYKTRTARSEEKIDEIILKHIKKPIDIVLSYSDTISDLSDVTLWEIFEECGVTAEQLGCVEKKVSISYKRKPHEVNLGPYDTLILKFFTSNMN